MGRKISIYEIVERLDSYGFMIIGEYHTLKDKVTITDSDGYLYHIKLDNLICCGRIPERFRKTNPYTLKNIQTYLDKHSNETKICAKSYTDAHTLMDFRCEKCGKIYQTSLNKVISRKQYMCPECSLIEKGVNHRVPLEIVKEEFTRSGLTPLFSDYRNCDEKLQCCDNENRVYEITYRSLSQKNKIGYSCYSMSRSKYEEIITDYLDANHIRYTFQYVLKGCCYKKALRFDFAVFLHLGTDLPDLLIEVDGQQHFKPIDFGGTGQEKSKELYDENCIRDEIKNTYCEDNGISLLRIPYFAFNDGTWKTILEERIYILQNVTA